MAISENSADVNVPAIQGENTAGGDGVVGTGRRGVVGVSDDFQGVFGKSRDNAGVVGESDKMHAVFGITHSTFAGVFGASDAGGAGVAGESKTGRGVHGASESGDGVFGTGRRGVVGESQTFQGVFGKSRDNAGVVGESDKMHAVFGITHSTFAGVFGTSDAGGAGVAGESNRGPGIFGKGSPAGRFEGIVEVTGGLVVANVDVTSRIAALERELAALKTRIAVLESRAGVPGGGGGASGSASIGVELRLTGGAFNELRIFGSGFNANEPVALTHESVERFPDGRQGGSSSTFQTTADSQGRINHTMSVSCPAGFQTTHTARARGVSSGRLSNNAAASC